MRTIPWSVFVTLMAALVACDGGGGGGGADGGVDASVDAPVVCSVSTATFGDRGALTPSSCIQDPGELPADPSDDVIVMLAPLQTGIPFDELEIELWAGFGALADGIADGDYPIMGDDLQYSTCGICVFISSQRTDPEAYVDDYFATGGTLHLTSVMGNLTGSINDLTFEHVTVDSGRTIPVGDGCVTAVAHATFTAPVTAPPAKPGQAQIWGQAPGS